MKLRNGKVLEIEREEAGDFYRFSVSEIADACRQWERRRGFVSDEYRRINFGKACKRPARKP